MKLGTKLRVKTKRFLILQRSWTCANGKKRQRISWQTYAVKHGFGESIALRASYWR